MKLWDLWVVHFKYKLGLMCFFLSRRSKVVCVCSRADLNGATGAFKESQQVCFIVYFAKALLYEAFLKQIQNWVNI